MSEHSEGFDIGGAGVFAYGPTPTTALIALAEKLEADDGR